MEDKIKEEALLDGFYIVRTIVDTSQLSAEQVVLTYKRLSVVERASKCTAHGDQVHSFHTALDDLATICCNTIEPEYQEALPFTTLTKPTAHQQKMLDILGVKL